EILVDNARTHSAKPFSINDFGKRSGTRCPVASIEYIDEVNNTKTLDCFFQSGLQKGQSKGLLAIALELGFKVSTNCKLEELKILLSCHKAFKNISKLEKLAIDYGFKVIFAPKFHCELNPIEGVWCHQKVFIRKHSDQTFNKMLRLIVQSRENFVEKKIYMKLLRRFWKAINAYQQGRTYGEVLKQYFSNQRKGAVTSHQKITKSNLSDI
ncbi:unnamed protein product, partial [Rotaria socialis]